MNWLLIVIFIVTISGCSDKNKMKDYSSVINVVCINGQQFIKGYKILANYPDKNGKPRSCVMQVK